MKKAMKLTLLVCITLLACALMFTACDSDSTAQTPNNVTDGTTTEDSTTDDAKDSTTAPGTDAHVHAFGEWETTKSASCTQDGYKERYCSCGEKQESTIVASGHTWGNWNVTKEATATETGSEERSCSCGEKETRDIPMIPVVTTITEAEWKSAFDFSKYSSFTISGSEKGSEDGVDFEFDSTIKYYGGWLYVNLDGVGYQGEKDFIKYTSTSVENFSDLYVMAFVKLKSLLNDFEELPDFGYSKLSYSAETKTYTTVRNGYIYTFWFEEGKPVKYTYEENGLEEYLSATYTFSDFNNTQKFDIPVDTISTDYHQLVNAISNTQKFYYYKSPNWSKEYYNTAELKRVLEDAQMLNLKSYEKSDFGTYCEWVIEISANGISISTANGKICVVTIYNSMTLYPE